MLQGVKRTYLPESRCHVLQGVKRENLDSQTITCCRECKKQIAQSRGYVLQGVKTANLVERACYVLEGVKMKIFPKARCHVLQKVKRSQCQRLHDVEDEDSGPCRILHFPPHDTCYFFYLKKAYFATIMGL